MSVIHFDKEETEHALLSIRLQFTLCKMYFEFQGITEKSLSSIEAWDDASNHRATWRLRKLSTKSWKIISNQICNKFVLLEGFEFWIEASWLIKTRVRSTFISLGRETTSVASDGSQCSQIRAHVTESALAVGSVQTAPLYQSLGRWLSCSRPSTITLRSPCPFLHGTATATLATILIHLLSSHLSLSLSLTLFASLSHFLLQPTFLSSSYRVLHRRQAAPLTDVQIDNLWLLIMTVRFRVGIWPCA